MATSLRLPMATTTSLSSSPSWMRRRSSHTVCAMKRRPLLSPNESFLGKLASIASNTPKKLIEPPPDTDTPPLLHLFNSPSSYRFMPSAAYEESIESASDIHRIRRFDRWRNKPKDLSTFLLDRRIVYIGLPLVPVVTELVIVQLMHLGFDDPNAPIYLYIDSTGTTQEDSQPVANESEGFAIYDVLMSLKTEIRTVALGTATGQACLLLAAGTKGRRYTLPNTKLMIQEPRVAPSGSLSASDVAIRAKELKNTKDTLVKLLAHHTGNSAETIANKINPSFYMDCVQAKEFGIVDEILWRGQEYLKDVYLPEEEESDTSAVTDDIGAV
ncbi:ATP-dependent Clp protease proteolytic subunit-related protein like [Actinidia chinensis var. chinensis]|uniref:ATP-dependent Clp protease proteolytic subunit n=1 Tax=Actinidia chinensis var. chinensis TaxID=1590841 RepID=A0A2R6RDA1_ACTCC|nr:ATP-dependent Clp protease proteolytic subunit-related protein like [Actinidia chinensis var. chinensis]